MYEAGYCIDCQRQLGHGDSGWLDSAMRKLSKTTHKDHTIIVGMYYRNGFAAPAKYEECEDNNE